jgi:hypothetical protein
LIFVLLFFKSSIVNLASAADSSDVSFGVSEFGGTWKDGSNISVNVDYNACKSKLGLQNITVTQLQNCAEINDNNIIKTNNRFIGWGKYGDNANLDPSNTIENLTPGSTTKVNSLYQVGSRGTAALISQLPSPSIRWDYGDIIAGDYCATSQGKNGQYYLLAGIGLNTKFGQAIMIKCVVPDGQDEGNWQLVADSGASEFLSIGDAKDSIKKAIPDIAGDVIKLLSGDTQISEGAKLYAMFAETVKLTLDPSFSGKDNGGAKDQNSIIFECLKGKTPAQDPKCIHSQTKFAAQGKNYVLDGWKNSQNKFLTWIDIQNTTLDSNVTFYATYKYIQSPVDDKNDSKNKDQKDKNVTKSSDKTKNSVDLKYEMNGSPKSAQESTKSSEQILAATGFNFLVGLSIILLLIILSVGFAYLKFKSRLSDKL